MKPTVVLYNPNTVFFTMPLALLAIGSYLKEEEFHVVIVDGRLDKQPLQTIEKYLGQNGVCFATTVLTGSPIKDALQVSQFVKSKFPEIPVVWGGWHVSLFPEQTLQNIAVDVVVKGQGELTFYQLLLRFLNKESLHGLLGIGYKEDNQIIINGDRPMEDINVFPPFNYDLIEVSKYRTLSKRNQIDYISSQGCRFRCAFCADPFVYKRGWYGFEAERVVSEIKSLWEKYQFDHVHFQDETFFTNSKRVKKIAMGFIENKLPITWFGTIRADQGVRLEEEVWELSKQSGLEKVMIGMEAGTQEMLNWMQKDIKLSHIYDTAQQCLKYDIAISFSVIVGFPGETEESINSTLQVVKELRQMSPKFQVGIFYFKPYPGNKIADELLAGGYKFASTLEEWSDFDYVNSGTSDWIAPKKIREIENFKFYQQLAYGKPGIIKYLPQQVARWRLKNKQYAFPFERTLKEIIKPSPRLS